MLDKLENAVDKISESNQRIANILAKHDERIEQSIKTDDLIVKMIEDVRLANSKEHQEVTDRIKTVESTVADLTKFKWQAVALTGAAVLIMGIVIPFVDNVIQMAYNGGTEQILRK
jgi:hypothetical protein